MNEKLIRIELPGGYVRLVTESTYNKLVGSMQELARALENAEYVEADSATPARLKPSLWRQLLIQRQTIKRHFQRAGLPPVNRKNA